jgi:hypothetical protein
MIQPRTLKHGVYPLIVEVILIAVILVMTFIVVSYVFSLVTTTKEQFELKPLLYITYIGLNPEPSLNLYIYNGGASSETLLRAEVITGSGTYRCDLNYVISAGFKGYLLIAKSSQSSGSATYVHCDWESQGDPKIVEGDFYTIKLYTARHGTMTFTTAAQRP